MIQPAAATLHRNEVKRFYTEAARRLCACLHGIQQISGSGFQSLEISRGGKLVDNRMDMTIVTSAHTWLLPGKTDRAA